MKEIVFYLIFFNPVSGYGTTPVNLGAYATKNHCELAKLEVAELGDRPSAIQHYKNRMKCVQSSGNVE